MNTPSHRTRQRDQQQRREISWYILLVVWFVLAATARAEQEPKVFQWNPSVLKSVRTACLSGANEYRLPLQRLIRDADKALATEPGSVMEKSQVPPSGDKHDYMSLARYFWPDPTKPDGLPYINRDGEVNPETRSMGDRETFGRLNSLVPTLALAYYMTGKDAYAAHAVRFLRTWFLDTATRLNPRFTYAQAVKGKNNGRPSGLIESRGLANVVDAVGLLAGYQDWKDEDQQGITKWFEEYLRWLTTSVNGKKEAAATNNHSVWYDVQSTAIALFVGQPDLAKQILERAKIERIEKQIEPDGQQPRELARTTSKHYTLFNIQAFAALANLGTTANVDLWKFRSADGRSIRKAIDWVIPFLTGEQAWTYKQINDFDASEYYPVLLQASMKFGDERYAKLADHIGGSRGSSDRIHLMVGK